VGAEASGRGRILPAGNTDVQLLTGPRLARALRRCLAVARSRRRSTASTFSRSRRRHGANLASRSALRPQRSPLRRAHRGQTARTAADAALDGARGNSGAIFAQFLHGCRSDRTRVTVTTKEFVARHAGALTPHSRRSRTRSRHHHLGPQRVDGGLEEQIHRSTTSASCSAAAWCAHVRPRQHAEAARGARAPRVVDAGAQGFVYSWRESPPSSGTDGPRTGAEPGSPSPADALRGRPRGSRPHLPLLLGGAALRRAARPQGDRKAVEPLGGSLVVAGAGRGCASTFTPTNRNACSTSWPPSQAGPDEDRRHGAAATRCP